MTHYSDHLYPLAPDVTALVVMATDLEYGAALKQLGIRPLITGVGPIMAAMTLTHALAALSFSRRPDVILNLGSAGSATLEQGGVYRVSSCAYRDMDASAFGFEKGTTPFSPHPAVIHKAAILPGIPSASCSTGANVVSDYAPIRADMAEMEYAALNEVAMRFGLPLIGLKGISDGKTPLTGKLLEWTELLPAIDRRLAGMITHIKDMLAQSELTKPSLCQMPAHWTAEHASFSPVRQGTLAA
ncbi:5'-methylthioadenosine/S-adenosylhomocysteine nucleosidase [bacterium]|nr:5'-methylthioadenosine/S-adenosylhomocysteine nucleosidase [bacterium]